ncbi:MAG: rhomboid family intramembrane serine protease [Sphaerochaetaceae bacterium]|nr:rhomboid family intramembrane serine protease [Sphaerochaetaceae bacterium]
MMKDSFLNKKFKYTYSGVWLYIVIANMLMFLATYYTNIRFKGVPLLYWVSLIPGCVNELGWIWQFVTYMFVHGSFSHLFFNMFALVMFGRVIERELGSKEFLLFYFVCGILGGMISYLFYLIQGVDSAVIMGASGCIYALLLLRAVLYPNDRLLLFFIIPVKMPVAVILYIAIEVVDQVVGLQGGVAHLIHLSCIAIAWIYIKLRFRLSPIAIWKDTL